MKISKFHAVVLLLFLLGTTAQAQTEIRTPSEFNRVNSKFWLRESDPEIKVQAMFWVFNSELFA